MSRYELHKSMTDSSVSLHDFKIPLQFLAERKKWDSSPLIVDGGAFRGKFIDKALAIFPNAEIHAYEPHPANLPGLNDKYPPNVHVYNKALGREVGKMELLSTGPEANPNSFLAGGPVPSKVNYRVNVGVTTIASELSRAPDLIKLDLQGGEESALKGAGDLLKAVPLMWVEAYLDRNRGKSLITFVEKAGFELFFGPFQYGVASNQVLDNLSEIGIRTGKSYAPGVNFGYLLRYDAFNDYGLIPTIEGLNYLACDMLCINKGVMGSS